jgi:DNA repair exonuclease SbcCD nuclease subunit
MATVAVVHISDLHLGASISGRGGFRIFPRATAHDEAALDALFAALAQIFQTYAYEHALVVSGDVSAWGSDAELRLYATLRNLGFARDAFIAYPPLQQDFDSTLDIPGNHDYWNGQICNASVNVSARLYFAPNSRSFQLRTASHLIALHGICSTFGSSRSEQPKAVGRYHPLDIRQIEASLQSSDSEASREGLRPFKLVVTHHSPSYGSAHANGLCTDSLKELSALCQRHDIKGVLTGHVHSRTVIPRNSSFPPEVRCGTTTQIDWLHRNRPRNFLYHEFSDTNTGALEWSMTPWDYNGVSFTETKRDRVVIFP